MSRSKRATSKARPSKRNVTPPTAGAPEQPWRRLRLALGLTVVGIGVVWLWSRPTAGKLYREAQAIFAKDADRADALLERSIELAGGNYPAAQVLRCRTLGRRGRWLEAAGCFGTLEDPPTAPANDLLQLGLEAEAAGQVLLSRLAFLAVTAGKSEHRPKALERLAVLDYSSGLIPLALKHAQSLQKLDPTNPIGWFIAGRIHREDLDFSQSAAAFRQALQHSNTPEQSRPTREELAGVLLELGELEAAREQIAALAQDGLSNTGKLLKAKLGRLEGRTEEALALVTELRHQSGVDAEQVQLLSGLLHLDAGQPELAAKDLEQVIAKNPHHADAHAKLGSAYQLLGRSTEAAHHLARGQELSAATQRILDLHREIERQGEQPALLEELAELYEKTGHSDLANRVRARVRPQ